MAPASFAVSDVVTTRRFSREEREDMARWSGCVVGALSRDEYIAGLEAAGFGDVEVEVTHRYDADVVSAVIRATA